MSEFNQSVIAQYLLFYVQYEVIICRPCQCAIHPAGLELHMRRFHKVYSLTIRTELVQYANSLTLNSVENVKALDIDPNSRPIEGLKTSTGYQCNVCNILYAM